MIFYRETMNKDRIHRGDQHARTFLVIFIALLFMGVTFSYWRYMVLRNYIVVESEPASEEVEAGSQTIETATSSEPVTE